MKVVIFGATGALGRECLGQALEAGHEVSVLVRTPSKLPPDLASRVTVHEGDGLDREAIARVLDSDWDAVLFAIGIDKHSPENLCTTATRHILDHMRDNTSDGGGRFIWCGGGSTLVAEDVVTLGARFVEFFARTFMRLRHHDKAHQYVMLQDNRDVEWVGLRPLQIRVGPRREEYRIGFNAFSGMSWTSFADVAHGMIAMLDDDTWLHKAPIVQC